MLKTLFRQLIDLNNQSYFRFWLKKKYRRYLFILDETGPSILENLIQNISK